MLSQRGAFAKRLAPFVAPTALPFRGVRSRLWSQLQLPPKRADTFTFLSPPANLARQLEILKQNKWGWLIYRTSYKHEHRWLKFQAELETRSKQWIASTDAPQIADSLEWTFVDDADMLDGVSKQQLRERHNQWAATAMTRENPRASPEPLLHTNISRYRYFIEMDETALLSVGSDASARAPLMFGTVALVDAQWKSMAEHGWEVEEDPDAESFEPIDGCTEEDVGWMFIGADMIYADFYAELGPQTWHASYRRPPDCAEA